MNLKAVLVLLSFAAQAQALSFKPVLMVEGRGFYESQQGRAQSGLGPRGSLFFAPALDFGKGLSLVPLMGYLGQGRGVPNPEDALFVERHTFFAQPQLAWAFSPVWTAKLKGWAKRAVNKEIVGEPFGTGLYDWEEFGGALGVDRKLGQKVPMKVGLELGLLHRGYPYWHESGASLLGGRNYYTKDYNGFRLQAGIQVEHGPGEDWSAELSYTQSTYPDAYVIQMGDGQYSATDKRADVLLRGEVRGHWALAPALQLELTLTGDQRSSNQNYVDINATPIRPLADSFGYLSLGGGAGLSWKPGKLSLRLGADFYNRGYSGRYIRNPDGAYTQGKQADFDQLYSLDAEHPFWLPGLSAVVGASWEFMSSNQGFVGQLRPTYDIFSASLGLRYRL